MLILLLFWITHQQCIINQDKQSNFYKQSQEIIRLNLYDYFYGYNLYFNNQQGYEIQNIINQQYITLINGTIIDTAFNVNIIILTQYQQSFLIYYVDSQQLNIIQILYIPQQQYQIYCNQIAFINEQEIIVNCYSNVTKIQNYLYTYILNDQFSWKQLQYYPTTNNNYIYYDLQTHQNMNYTYIIIGTYTDQLIGVIEIYNMKQFNGQPIQVFNQQRSFQIYEQLIYIMNVTQTIKTYQLSNMSQVNEFTTLSFKDPQVELLAFNVLTQDTLLIYINQVGDNLYEIQQNDIINKYIVRIDYQQTMVQLYNYAELIGLQIGQKYFLYDRIKQTIIINTQQQNLINLYPLITYQLNTIYNYQILEPAIFINSTQNSIIIVQAISYQENIQIECNIKFNVFIHSELPILQIYNKSIPNQAILKKEITYINALNFVSGSLLQLSGSTQINQTQIYDVSQQVQLSQQIWNQIGGVYQFYSADFESTATFILQYEYSKEIIKFSYISLRICDINLLQIIDLNELECMDYIQIYEINAPITKLQFTDLTDPDEIYFVANIAHSAVIVYKLTQVNAFSQIKTEFICEPLPKDELGYQHQITDFYIIGSNLYLLISRIQQIWIYDLEKCDKIYIITNELFDGPFYPSQIAGITIIDELNIQKSIIFINSIQIMYVIQIYNNKVEYKNKLILQSGNIINISIIKENIILVINDIFTSIQQYYYSIEQPSNTITFIKKLPQYGVTISNKYIIESDSQLFYILMNNNYYYVYNPQLTASDCLIQQLNYIGDYLSASFIPNILQQSNVIIASKTNIVIYSITNPSYLSIQFIQNVYNEENFLLEYQSTITSPLCKNEINLKGQILAYNTLFKATLNYETFLQDNNLNLMLPTDTLYYEQQIYLQSALPNNIIGYVLRVLTPSTTTNIKLQGPLNFQYLITNTPNNIRLMTFDPNSDNIYLQNTTQLFLYQSGIYIQLSNFTNLYYTNCYDLVFQQNLLISLCSRYNENVINVYNISNSITTQYYFPNTQFYLPIKMSVFSNQILILGIWQGFRDYSIIITQLYNNNYTMESLLKCQINNSDSSDVSDYITLQLPNFILIIFTCPFQQQVQYATFNYDFYLINQSVLHLSTILPKKATLHELELITYNTTQIQFVLSTKQFYSYIISTNYDTINQEYIQLTQVTTNYEIAPMQDSIMLSGLLYYNQFLFAQYFDQTNNQHLLALYNLNLNNNITKFYSIDAILFQGQMKYTISGQSQNLYIIENAQPLFCYNYNNQTIIQFFNIQKQSVALSLIIEQKYGIRQYLPLKFQYPSAIKTENWIKYTCIGIGFIYVLILLGIILLHGKKKKKSEDQISLELN